MSRGLGSMQREIIELLLVRGPHKTGRIFDVLSARKLLNRDKSRKQHTGAITRACNGLVERGLVEGAYEPDAENLGRTTVRWAIAGTRDARRRLRRKR